MQLVFEAKDGQPVGVGRLQRVVPAWIGRLVRQRDIGCRFPGCGRTHLTHCHHIRAWAHGGRTDLDNLCLLCAEHHRLLHEFGWSILGHPDDELWFFDPTGTIIQKPKSVDPKLFDRLMALVPTWTRPPPDTS